MCLFLKRAERPEFEAMSVAGETAREEIDNSGLKLLYPVLLDATQPYYFVTLAQWNEILLYVYKDYPWPKYMTARMDCDDFALLFKGLVSAEFGLNYFGLAIGTCPGGAHAFNVFRIETGELVLFEPQTGMILDESDGYKANYILL